MQFEITKMKRIIILLLTSIILSCNSKTEDTTSKEHDEILKTEIQNKLTGKEIVDELEKLDFFKLTDKTELENAKIDLEKAYNELNFFEGKLQGESLIFVDNRFYFMDCEELFEIGGLTEYLNLVKMTFEKLNLILEYSNEKSEQTENYWKHTIELNGKVYSAFDGKFTINDWGIAYVKFIEMLNDQLKLQGSKEKFYPISSGNDGKMVLLTVKQFDFVKKHYPNDNEHPKSMSKWKSENGL